MKTRTERFCFVTEMTESSIILLTGGIMGVIAQIIHSHFDLSFWIWLIMDVCLLLALFKALWQWPEHCQDFKHLAKHPYQWIWMFSDKREN